MPGEVRGTPARPSRSPPVRSPEESGPGKCHHPMRQTWQLALVGAVLTAVLRNAPSSHRWVGRFDGCAAKRPPTRYGQELSVELQMTSSRSSQPAGWLSAKTTAAATSAGALSTASAGGLYCSV